MGRRKRQPAMEPFEIQGPARILPGEVYELVTAEPKLGGARHLRNFSHPLDLALQREKISDEQWAAGDAYRSSFLLRGRSGVDSTQGASGGSSGMPFSQVQFDAIKWLQLIDGKLSLNDVTIIRAFCGEGHSMVDALRLSGVPHSPHGVLPRIHEALDNLGRAIISRRKKTA